MLYKTVPMEKLSVDISTLVRQHFPQLAERDLQEEIAKHGMVYQFQAGEVIMGYGSYIKMVPLIVEGSIKVMREDEQEGKEILLYLLQAGETCSMSFTCCMMNKKSAIRTEAVETTTLIGIPIQQVDSWMTRYQSWKNFVMMTYDARMLELVRFIDQITFQGLDQRLELYLRRLQKTTGNQTFSLTQQEIAKDLNVTREAISRLLKRMSELGKVKVGRNQITWLGG